MENVKENSYTQTGVQNASRAGTVSVADSIDWLLKQKINNEAWNKINKQMHDFYESFGIKKIKVLTLSGTAKIPTKAHDSDAGYDLYSDKDITLLPGHRAKIPTAIAIAIPKGYSGFIWDRSGIGSKGVKVHGGVIDSSYRGEIMVCLGNYSSEEIYFPKGSKIAQIVFKETPHFEMVEVDDLDETVRGNKGFGSSGN